MRPEDRLSYAAPFDHPQRSAPGGAAVIVWPVVNVENWLIDNPMPRQVLVAPTGVVLKPDVANWGWHEYGMRVGFWRLHDAFARRGLKPTLSINGSVCDAYPRLAGAAHDSGWEFMGHGFVQVPTPLVEDQRRMIADTVERIHTFTGRPCEGWLGPGLTETLETPDLLAEAGVRYVADWVVDDTPCRLPTRAGDLVTMPYTLELNDIAINMIQYHGHDELRLRAQRAPHVHAHRGGNDERGVAGRGLPLSRGARVRRHQRRAGRERRRPRAGRGHQPRVRRLEAQLRGRKSFAT